MTFQTLTLRDAGRLRPYYQDCGYGLCEYSLGVKLMWRHYFHPQWAQVCGCLVVRNRIEGRDSFDFPVPGGEGDVEGALQAIEAWCAEKGVPLRFNSVPESELPRLLARYPYTRCTHPRTWQDYLYRRSDLAELAGRHYAGQRNHIHKFRRLYPQAAFRPLTQADAPLLAAFWEDFAEQFPKDSASARKELEQSKRLLRRLDRPWLRVGGMLCEGKLIGISAAELCGDTLVIHIEKALYSYEGVYPALASAFAAAFGQDALYLNREDDAGDAGLRRSKTQYRPVRMGEKYLLEVQNELYALRELPMLETERLTLSALTEHDRRAYYELCTDDAHNRLWGYDYRQDLTGELTEDYFLRVVEEDFRCRRSLSFAVRREGRCIGEAVLYRFDGTGSAELGCRIAASEGGRGYGREAFAAAAEWAMYGLGLRRVFAKCYRENAASYKMLSAALPPIGEDETFYYFEKLL